MRMLLGCWLLSALGLQAASLKNGGFEIDFGTRGEGSMWGDMGEAWGEAWQVEGKTEGHPKARMGSRLLLLNVPPNSWNGAWQQIPWKENQSFWVEGYCWIQGGDLPGDCATFLKVEFFDGLDQKLGEAESEHRMLDTKKSWVRNELKGKTPPKTAALRVVVVAGSNPDGQPLLNRIYWDEVEVKK